MRASATLRNDMTMCIRERVDVRPWSDALATDIARVQAIWIEGAAPLRQGRPVPVRRVLARRCVLRAGRVPLPDLRRCAGRRRPASTGAACSRIRFVREWEAAALAETAIIEADEPRIVYRDKLKARGRL